jgi:predicted dehydrogenase
MTDPVRFGVLGVASINAATVPAILASPRATLAGIASRSSLRAQRAADEHGTAAYSGYEALLADPLIDAVYIPTPNAQHAEWSIAAARAGKHVLCEKPLAVTAEEAERMFAAADEAGVLLLSLIHI